MGWVKSSFLESNSQPRSQALSKQEIEAALDARDEVESSTPETSKPSVGSRKSKKHGSRHSHRKRGYSFRILVQTSVVAEPRCYREVRLARSGHQAPTDKITAKRLKADIPQSLNSGLLLTLSRHSRSDFP